MYYSPCKDVQACNYRSETSEGDKTHTQLKNYLLLKQHNPLPVLQVGARESFTYCSDFGLSSQKNSSSNEETERIILSEHSCITALQPHISVLRYFLEYHQCRAGCAKPQCYPCTIRELITCRKSETHC